MNKPIKALLCSVVSLCFAYAADISGTSRTAGQVPTPRIWSMSEGGISQTDRDWLASPQKPQGQTTSYDEHEKKDTHKRKARGAPAVSPTNKPAQKKLKAAPLPAGEVIDLNSITYVRTLIARVMHTQEEVLRSQTALPPDSVLVCVSAKFAMDPDLRYQEKGLAEVIYARFKKLADVSRNERALIQERTGRNPSFSPRTGQRMCELSIDNPRIVRVAKYSYGPGQENTWLFPCDIPLTCADLPELNPGRDTPPENVSNLICLLQGKSPKKMNAHHVSQIFIPSRVRLLELLTLIQNLKVDQLSADILSTLRLETKNCADTLRTGKNVHRSTQQELLPFLALFERETQTYQSLLAKNVPMQAIYQHYMSLVKILVQIMQTTNLIVPLPNTIHKTRHKDLHGKIPHGRIGSHQTFNTERQRQYQLWGLICLQKLLEERQAKLLNPTRKPVKRALLWDFEEAAYLGFGTKFKSSEGDQKIAGSVPAGHHAVLSFDTGKDFVGPDKARLPRPKVRGAGSRDNSPSPPRRVLSNMNGQLRERPVPVSSGLSSNGLGQENAMVTKPRRLNFSGFPASAVTSHAGSGLLGLLDPSA